MTLVATLKRNWFLFTLASNLLTLLVILKIINKLPDMLINPTRKKEISTYLSCLFAKFIFCLNPHIQITSLTNWKCIKNDGSMIFVINHTSPIDAFLFAAMLPLKYAAKVRTLFKAELLDIPIFGEVTRYCGHFPVHFNNSSEINNFSVDKVKQAKVIEDIVEHLNNRGHIAFFPEAQLNRSDTSKLQPFRHGSFKIFSDVLATNQTTAPKNLTMYSFLHSGLEHAWHPEAQLGGYPAQVYYNVFPLLFSIRSSVQEIQATVQKHLSTIPPSGKPKAKL